MMKGIKLDRKTSKLLIKNLIVLFSVVAVAFVGSWSWLTLGSKSNTDNLGIKCIVPDGLEIAVVKHGDIPTNSDYKDGTVVLNKSFFGDDDDGLYMSEITGNGISFYKPTLEQIDGVASPVVDNDWDPAVANKDYVSVDIYMRTKEKQTVYLLNTSNISPKGSIGSGKTYSTDAVVGAARLSILDNNGSRKLLWIPAPHIYFDAVNNSLVTTRTSGVTYQHSYYEVTNNGKGTKTYTTLSAPTVTANSQEKYTLGKFDNKQFVLAELSSPDASGYYINHVTCNIWIEGEDAEARLAMVGGKFTATLNLSLDE